MAKSFNKEYDFVTRMKVMGTTEHRTAEIAVKDLNLPITVDEFKKTVQAMGKQRLQNVPLFRGILLTHKASRIYFFLLIFSFKFVLLLSVFFLSNFLFVLNLISFKLQQIFFSKKYFQELKN